MLESDPTRSGTCCRGSIGAARLADSAARPCDCRAASSVRPRRPARPGRAGRLRPRRQKTKCRVPARRAYPAASPAASRGSRKHESRRCRPAARRMKGPREIDGAGKLVGLHADQTDQRLAAGLRICGRCGRAPPAGWSRRRGAGGSRRPVPRTCGCCASSARPFRRPRCWREWLSGPIEWGSRHHRSGSA